MTGVVFISGSEYSYGNMGHCYIYMDAFEIRWAIFSLLNFRREMYIREAKSAFYRGGLWDCVKIVDHLLLLEAMWEDKDPLPTQWDVWWHHLVTAITPDKIRPLIGSQQAGFTRSTKKSFCANPAHRRAHTYIRAHTQTHADTSNNTHTHIHLNAYNIHKCINYLSSMIGMIWVQSPNGILGSRRWRKNPCVNTRWEPPASRD